VQRHDAGGVGAAGDPVHPAPAQASGVVGQLTRVVWQGDDDNISAFFTVANQKPDTTASSESSPSRAASTSPSRPARKNTRRSAPLPLRSPHRRRNHFHHLIHPLLHLPLQPPPQRGTEGLGAGEKTGRLKP
jgi:hypothetical protein